MSNNGFQKLNADNKIPFMFVQAYYTQNKIK